MAKIDRPTCLKPILNGIPEVLKAIARWVVWRFEYRKGWTKPPLRSDGRGYASVADHKTWSTFDAAWAAYKTGRFDGIGFVLTDDDDIVGVDLDHVINEKSELDPEAAKIIAKFASYTEISPSGTGIRIICRAGLPGKGTKKGNYEIYGSGRYLTITGRVYGDD